MIFLTLLKWVWGAWTRAFNKPTDRESVSWTTAQTSSSNSTSTEQSNTTAAQQSTKSSTSTETETETSPVQPDTSTLPLPPLPPPPEPKTKAPWLKLARAEDGVRENTSKKKHNQTVVDYFADAGFPGIKNDETAWCAAFANAMLARAGYATSKSLAARSFLQYGKKLKAPLEGCLVVFKRDNSSWQGHVGFYVGENKTHIYVLGGNQRNAVNVAKYPKSKWLGYRWPPTALGSRTVVASAAGTAGTGVAALGEALLPLAREVQTLADISQVAQILGTVVALVSFAIVLYARYDDWKEKGR